MQCTTTNSTDDPSRIDLFALNSYSWCGDSSYTTSGYNVLVSDFSSTTVPVFFSEYGCNVVLPRTFTEVPVIYGPLMTPVLSGGIVYEYSNEVSNFGLVDINSNGSVQLRSDYDAFSTQLLTLNITLLQEQPVTNGTVTPPTCSSFLITTAGFANNFTLPAVPPGVQDLIDNGISNKPSGKIVPVTTTKVSQTVQQSNGDIIQGLAIVPLKDDESNNPGVVTPSSTTSSAPAATTTKKNGAGRTKIGCSILLGISLSVVVLSVLL